MQNNKEVKIAIAVAIIMITFCLIVFLFNKADKQEVTNLDLKVYKLYELDDDSEEEYEYRQCSISTEDLITINKEAKRIFNLDEDKKTIGKSIKGNYKIIIDDKYIAFDADDKDLVYRSDLPAIFEFDSTLYKTVKELCE